MVCVRGDLNFTQEFRERNKRDGRGTSEKSNLRKKTRVSTFSGGHGYVVSFRPGQ